MHHTENEARRAQLYGLLGDLPARDLPLESTLIWEKECEKYTLQKVRLDVNGLEPVYAYVTLPKTGKAPYPAVVFCHSHGGGYDIGKEEYIRGREYMYRVPYADDLSDAGFAGIAIDHWCFGERNTRTENDTFKAMLWHGRVMWGMMVYDSLRAVDYLCTREEIDSGRIAALGMSMGSTMAWWLSALDTRIAACADICCLTDFEALLKENGLKEHGIYYYVPSLLKYFSTADINSLIAPRPHFSVNGRLDPLTPEKGLYKIDRILSDLYASLGVPENWHLRVDEVAHQETEGARKEILAFLKRHLH